MKRNDFIKELSHVRTRHDMKEALEKQIFNVKAFASLDRNGLEFNRIERRVLLYTSTKGENIYIQFPGKESIIADSNKKRPWDFRPRLCKDSVWMKDQSFKDVWNELESLENDKYDYLSILAAMFYRYSALLDFKKVTEDLPYQDIDIENNKIIGNGTIKNFTWYKLIIKPELSEFINKHVSKINKTFSFESYIYYNDLLCQNEDCKYYYRDKFIKHQDWKGKVGRNNTYKTHMSVIAFLRGDITFSGIMDMFQKGLGVAPIQNKLIKQVTNNIIKEEENND